MSASRAQASHSPHPDAPREQQHSNAPSPPPRQSPPPGEDEDDNRYNMFRHSDDDDEDGGGAGNNDVGGEAAASEEGPHHIPKSPEYAACAAAAAAAAKRAVPTATTEVKVGGVSFARPAIQSSTRRSTRGSAMKQTDDDVVEEERNHNDHQNVVVDHHSGYNNEEVDAEHALLQLATAPSWGSIIDIQKVETFDAQEDSSRSGSSSRAHSVNSNVITPASIPRKSTSYDANFIYPPSSPIKSTRTEDEDVRSSPVVEDDGEYDNNDEEHPGGEVWMPPPSNFTRGRPRGLGEGGYHDGGGLNTYHIPPPQVRPQFVRPGGSSHVASYGHPRLVDSSSRDSNESTTFASGRIQAVGRQDEWDAHSHYQQHQQPWITVSHSRSDDQQQQQGGSNEWDPPQPTRPPFPTYHYHPHHPSYPPHHADYYGGIERSSSNSGTVGGGGVYPPGGPPQRGGGGGSSYPPMHYQHGYPPTTHHSFPPGYSSGAPSHTRYGGLYRSSHLNTNSTLPPHYPPQGVGFAGGTKDEADDDYYGLAHTSSSSLNSSNNDVEIQVPRPQFQNVKRGKTSSSSSAASGGAGGTMKQRGGVDTIEGGIMSLPYQKNGRVYDVMTGEAITTPALTKRPIIRRRRRNPTEKAAAAAAMAAAAAAAMRERNAAKQTAVSLTVDKNKANNSVEEEDRDNDGRMVEGGGLVTSPFSEEELKTLGSGDDEDIPAAKRAAMASALALRAAAGGSPVEPPKSAAEVEFDIADPPLGPVMPPSDIAAIDSTALMSENDVLCGRGGGTNSQMGNRRFRALVRDFQPTYLMAKRREKPKMARSVVLIVRKRGGRFLRRDDTDGRLYEVGDEKAEAKTSQALREGLDVRATKTAANTLMGTTAIETTIRKRKSTSPIENENYSVKRLSVKSDGGTAGTKIVPVRPQPVHAPGYARGPPRPGPPLGYYPPYQPRYDDPYYHGRYPPPPPGTTAPGSYDYRAPPPPSTGSSFGYHYPANYPPGYAGHTPPYTQGYPSSPPRSSCEAMSTSSPTPPKTDAFSPPRNTGINKHPQSMHQQLTLSESQDDTHLNEE